MIDTICTGDELRVDLAKSELTNLTTGDTWTISSLGEVAPIIEAGGIFNYAKSVGMLKS